MKPTGGDDWSTTADLDREGPLNHLAPPALTCDSRADFGRGHQVYLPFGFSQYLCWSSGRVFLNGYAKKGIQQNQEICNTPRVRGILERAGVRL